MARYRSRRNTRRTASQTAASLLALALPAPVQRVADTRIGPLLMLVGVPTMLALGLLNIDWSNGAPNLSIDQRRASELQNVTRETLNRFETQGGLQGLGHAASELINHAQSYANQYNNPYANQYGQQSNTYSQPSGYAQSQYGQSQHGQTQYGQPSMGSHNQRGLHATLEPRFHRRSPAKRPQPRLSKIGATLRSNRPRRLSKPVMCNPVMRRTVTRPTAMLTTTAVTALRPHRPAIIRPLRPTSSSCFTNSSSTNNNCASNSINSGLHSSRPRSNNLHMAPHSNKLTLTVASRNRCSEHWQLADLNQSPYNGSQ